jgi:hypothetical protein
MVGATTDLDRGALELTLGVALALLAAVRFQLRGRRVATGPSPAGGADHLVVPLRLLAPGIAIAAAGIGVLAVNGFAPHGHLNVVALVAVLIGLIVVAAAGRVPMTERRGWRRQGRTVRPSARSR